MMLNKISQMCACAGEMIILQENKTKILFYWAECEYSKTKYMLNCASENKGNLCNLLTQSNYFLAVNNIRCQSNMIIYKVA